MVAADLRLSGELLGDEPKSTSAFRWLISTGMGGQIALKHDPEKCAAVFGKDHAQTRS
jgi:hypothetical protein